MRPLILFAAPAFLFSSVPLFAGLAIFSPASQDVTPGTIATMDITLTTQQLPNFDSTDVVIQSPDANIFGSDWAYSLPFINLTAGLTDPKICGIVSCGSFIFVGGYAGSGSFGNSILLGTLSVDTTGFAPGTYNYLIDSPIGDLGWRGASEPLSGQGVIHVVPEPVHI